MHKQHYKLSGASICKELHIDETPHQLFSSLSVMYPTILNVVKHGKRVKQMKTTYLVKVKWGRNNKQQFRKIPMCIFRIWYCSAPNHILELLNMQDECTMLN